VTSIARSGLNDSNLTDALARTAWTCLVAAAILLGTFFRFWHLAEHGFWGDEGITALHAAGHTEGDVLRLLGGVRPVPASAVNALRLPGASGPVDVVRALAAEDAWHPPFYYVLVQGWERVAGTSPARLRLLSALISLLLLPAVFWLCVELFESRTVAWTAVAIAAISPFNVEYAQQAREYALWGVFTVVAGAVLLRALASQRRSWWIAYAVLTALGFYTHTFYAMVLCGHAAYVVGLRVKGDRAALPPFLVAAGVGVLASLPWYAVIFESLRHKGAHGFFPQDVKGAVYAWIVALSSPFVDLEFLSLKYFVAVGGALLLEIVAFVALVRSTRFAQWWFAVSLAASTLLLQIGNFGFTDEPRYLTPGLLAVEIAVAWLLGSTIAGTRRERSRWGSGVALAVFAAVVAFGAADCFARARTPIWWTNTYGAPLARLAARIDAGSPNPLVVGQPRDWEVVTDLASLLRPTDQLSLSTAVLRSQASPPRPAQRAFLFSRYGDLAASVSAWAPVHPIDVEVPRFGYGLIEARRTKQPVQRVTWLWTVGG